MTRPAVDAVGLAQALGALTLEHRRRKAQGRPVDDLLPQARSLRSSAETLGVRDVVAAVDIRHGEILLSMGRHPEAAAALETARGLLGGLREHDLEATLLANLAEVRGKQGDWKATDEVSAEGIRLVERYRYKVSAQYMQAAYLRQRIGLYAWGVRAALELGDAASMLERAELSKGRGSLRRRVVGESEEIATREREFRRVCERIDEARKRGPVPTKLLAERHTLWDLLSIERQRAASGEDLARFSLEAVQTRLRDDEAVLYYYWLDRHRLLRVCLDRTRIDTEVHELSPDRREALRQDAAFIRSLQGPAGRLDRICRDWAHLLPTANWLEEKTSLLVSRHQVLHAFPFHAFRYRGEPLLRRFAVSYVPNLSSLLMSYTPPSERSLVAVGIDDYEVPGMSVRTLPQAEAQTEAVAELYRAAGRPAVCLLGADALETRLGRMDESGRLREFGCLHLTTHGENIPGDTPMESALYMRDSILDGLDIACWRLDAELVVLSACCSGQRSIDGRGLDELPGDEMLGLQAAFFAAGAHRIVSALWPVDGNVSGPVLEEFHRRFVSGDSPERALQAAIVDFLDNRAAINTRRAYYWAPFSLVSMGRPETP